MTSDARATELIRAHFATQWMRVAPDVTFAVDGRMEPRDEIFAHLEVWTGSVVGRVGWVHLRCWVPLLLQISATVDLHLAAREVLEDVTIASDDGRIVIGRGERVDIGRDGRWWMSVISFPFSLVNG